MARKTKNKSLNDVKKAIDLSSYIGLAGTIFPAGTQLNPCICQHEPKQHEFLYEEESLAEWYLNCHYCTCQAFRQMDNLSYVKWMHDRKKS